MTTVSSTTETASVPKTTATQPGMISSDFQTFLTLMTTQLRNQDPTDPMESSEFAVQLATFSQVEQQVKTNDLLSSLSARLGGSEMTQYADWVGRQALVGSDAQFDGATPISMVVDAASGADQTVLVIHDVNGAEVSRLPIPVTSSEIIWTGQNASGQTLPSGKYSFSLESFSNGASLSITPAEVYGTITEVRLTNEGEANLVLDSGSTVLPNEIRALREPAS